MMGGSRKSEPNPLTAEDNAYFDACVDKWQEKLGLQGWRIERSRKRARARFMAEVEMDHKARLATYRTGDFGATRVTKESIEQTALHELLHIVLYELVNQTAISLEEEALESAEHRVIHVLERLLLEREGESDEVTGRRHGNEPESGGHVGAAPAKHRD